MLDALEKNPLRTLWVASRAKTRLLFLGLGAIYLVVFTGCAADQGTINYVQPAYLKKSDLLGKHWYYRRTVVDTPENGRGPDGSFGSWVTVGMGDLFTIERLTFDVQENYLVGYRDYEFVPGADEAENGSNAVYRGTPVVAFPILSHFDILNDYNPATGEEMNTIRENTLDRPWHERDYIRVDWRSTTLSHQALLFPIDDVDTNGVKGASEYIHENDATNPYRARIDPAAGYLDFVNNHYVAPDINTCYYDFDFSIYNITGCGAGEIKVRHAFWLVDQEQNDGYEPLFYPDSVVLHKKDDATGEASEVPDDETNEVVREGVFDRFGYYRLDKMTWDDERGLTESGRLYRIIRFNIWQQSVDEKGASIPYAERKIRPIVYYLNWDFPTELREVAFEVAAEWNAVFKETVASLQGKSLDALTQDLFILQDNACSLASLDSYLTPRSTIRDRVIAALGADIGASNLENACAAAEYFSSSEKVPFVWQQIGDPRFNMMVWLNDIIPAAFSGYGPMLADPVSGRNVVSTAYVLGWTVDSAATRALEYVDYMNDELTLSGLLSGSNLPNYFFDGAFDPHARALRAGPLQYAADTTLAPERIEELEQRFAENGSSFQEMMTPIDNSAHFLDRLSRVVGTDFERQHVLRTEDLMLASRGKWRPGMAVTDNLYDAASFLQHSFKLSEKQQRTRRYLEERAMCPLAELDGALVGLAKRLKDLPREERLLTLRKSIFKAVMLHEIGHNVGLRHNFEGSYDSLNYHREYWDLEKEHGTGEAAEISKQENSQSEYKYSSIMDYHGRVNADFRGLGPYDRAAVKFGYGQLVETFADQSISGGRTLRDFMFENDYRDLVYADTDGVGSQDEAYFPSVEAIYERRDVVFDWTAKDLEQTSVRNLLRNEVPYRFCSDEFAGYTPTCKRFDFGSNQREVQLAAVDRYRNYFIFSNFLRNRLTLDFSQTSMRSQSTFMDTIRTYQWFYLYRSSRGADFSQTDLYADLAQGVATGLNLMQEVIALPSPSTYYPCTKDALLPSERTTYFSLGFLDYNPTVDAATAMGPDGESCDMSAAVPLGLGQAYPMFFGFSEEYYNWTFAYLGTYWDKLTAIQLLTYPLAQFPRVNQEENSLQAYSISLYRLYSQEVNEILSSLIEYDRHAAGSILEVNGDSASVQSRNLFLGSGAEAPSSQEPRVVPALARNLQLYSLIYGMAFLTSPFDQSLDFADHAKVVVKGGADDFFDASGITNVVECTLPEGGLTYRAAPTGSPLDESFPDVAYDLVQRCKEAVDERTAKKVSLESERATLAGLTPQTEAHTEQAAEVDLAESAFEASDARVRQVEQVLLWTRDLNRIYEYGAGY